MRIENRTPWKTEHLRAITQRVLEDVVSAEVRKEAFIRFVSSRSGRVTGFAYYKRVYVRHEGPFWFTTVRLPSPTGLRARILAKWTEQNPVGSLTQPVVVDHVDLAATIAHETGHWGGRRNRDLKDSHVHGINDAARGRFVWAADMPLEPAERKVVPIDLREARRVRDYQAKVREWETKTKRSQTALTRWRRRLALAESRLQKAARP